MKKVICVDANHSVFLTENKKYSVLSETTYHYIIANDRGAEVSVLKEWFRPVPEQEYQYGQEVEYNGKKATYIGKSPTSKDGIIIIEIEHSEDKQEIAYCQLSDIRPVQSMRERVKELIQLQTSVKLSEVEIDRIIELVKNEKK